MLLGHLFQEKRCPVDKTIEEIFMKNTEQEVVLWV